MSKRNSQADIGDFPGFSAETFAFLTDLHEHNEKPWFLANEKRYRAVVLTPLLELVEALAEPMLNIDSDLVVAPAIAKTVSRIYRDTRFSKDKSPFRSNMWITFKRVNDAWQDAPGFYFSISPEGYSYGMGMYEAQRETMDRFRQSLLIKPSVFRKAIAGIPSRLILLGEMYVRPQPCDVAEDLRTWYQRKSFHLSASGSVEKWLFTPRAAARLVEDFTALAPLYRYLWSLKGTDVHPVHP